MLFLCASGKVLALHLDNSFARRTSPTVASLHTRLGVGTKSTLVRKLAARGINSSR